VPAAAHQWGAEIVVVEGGLARQVLADQVKERLLEGILAGRYPPDSRIVETQVARELGTSQAPVREALRGLEGLGFIEITPFRGARVRRPSRRDIVEAYTVRSTLEVLAARLALPRLTVDDIAGLASVFETMQRAAEADDGVAVAEADAAFHARIVELADNATLRRVWGSLEPLARTYLTLVTPGADARWSAALHGPVLEAFRSGDTGAVVAALERHFEDVRDHMARVWPEGDSGPGQSVVTGQTSTGR